MKLAQTRAEPQAAPLFLYDDATARRFEPFALTRPVGELRAGTELIRRRWELCMGRIADGAIAAGHLADFEELGAPAVVTDATPSFVLRAGSIVANTRCVLQLGTRESQGADVWTCGGRVAAVRLGRDTPLAELPVGRTRSATVRRPALPRRRPRRPPPSRRAW